MLLLDEPTNDLDVNTMRDRVATHILAFEGDSRVYWYDDSYSEYEEDKRRRLGAEADQPHRIRYRQLSR